MAQTSFFNGKVIHNSLPVLQAPFGSEAPQLKRLLLPQGELAQFHDSPPLRYLAYIELRTGIPRGNHFHRTKVEYVYMIAGSARLQVEDIASREQTSIPLHAGDLALIQPEIAHAIVPLEPGQAIEFSPTSFDASDIFRFPLENP